MPASRRFIDFNKQILVGELGAPIGTPLAPWIAARYTTEPVNLSIAAMVGAWFGGSVFWLGMRILDERRRGGVSVRRLAGHIAYFTPAALVAGWTVYQPLLFFTMHRMVTAGQSVVWSAFAAQAVAFGSFLALLNVYRLLLAQGTGREL
jgi:hypothetical protein